MSRLKKKVRLVMYSLAVGLKREYNDPEVEKQMIASSLTYLSALLICCLSAMAMFVIKACLDIVRHAYPDVKDKSALADLVRALSYIVWWILVTRVFAVFILVITLTTCLGYQFKNLQSYFSSLADIFERKDLSQTEKENKYEEGLKIGIKLHSESLKCAKETQAVCRGVFSGQIIFNVLLLVVLLYQMANSERTLVNIFGTVTTASAVLISTGFYMCNAGDVTVEASRLPTAIYLSGWHHCRGKTSIRLRKLLVVTMAHSQRPVVLKGLGYLELSYQSYITVRR
uniref:Odorant receptor n=1 Tax=Heliothis virescens TaxID=7102 RepID=A0A2A4J9Y6_HELVI